MSNRTLVELNHDYCPDTMAELYAWANAMRDYMRSGDKSALPQGVTFKYMRHHSEPTLDELLKDARDAGITRQVDYVAAPSEKPEGGG